MAPVDSARFMGSGSVPSVSSASSDLPEGMHGPFRQFCQFVPRGASPSTSSGRPLLSVLSVPFPGIWRSNRLEVLGSLPLSVTSGAVPRE